MSQKQQKQAEIENLLIGDKFGSAEAGKNSALIYTLIENCKLQGLDPEKYLAEVLERLPADASEEQAAELTPRRIAAAQKEKTAAQAQTAA